MKKQFDRSGFCSPFVTVIPAVSDARARVYHRPYYGPHNHGGGGWGLVGQAAGALSFEHHRNTMRQPPVNVAPPHLLPPPRAYTNIRPLKG